MDPEEEGNSGVSDRIKLWLSISSTHQIVRIPMVRCISTIYNVRIETALQNLYVSIPEWVIRILCVAATPGDLYWLVHKSHGHLANVDRSMIRGH